MKTYPEMNAKIVGILRISDRAEVRYAADRIEELEKDAKERNRAIRELAGSLQTSTAEVLKLKNERDRLINKLSQAQQERDELREEIKSHCTYIVSGEGDALESECYEHERIRKELDQAVRRITILEGDFQEAKKTGNLRAIECDAMMNSQNLGTALDSWALLETNNMPDASQQLCARCGQKSKIGGLRLITHKLPMELICFSCWYKQLYGIEGVKQAKDG